MDKTVLAKLEAEINKMMRFTGKHETPQTKAHLDAFNDVKDIIKRLKPEERAALEKTFEAGWFNPENGLYPREYFDTHFTQSFD